MRDPMMIVELIVDESNDRRFIHNILENPIGTNTF